MTWVYLAGAIFTEVAATLVLKVASAGRPRLYTFVVAGYATAFLFLVRTLDRGMGLGVAYGIWAAVGVALTALMSKWLFDEALTRMALLGIALIIVGVLCIELGSN
ncbi:SMR family transporter [Nocardioides sp. AN3]